MDHHINGKGKKHKIKNEIEKDSDDEQDEESSEDEEMEEYEEIDVDFDAVTPVESDFHGIEQLLLRLILNIRVDVSSLAGSIVEQTDVGSVIKLVDDDEDAVYGVASMLSLNKESTWAEDLKREVLLKCGDCAKEQLEQFTSIFREKRVGYLVNERFINIPPHVAVPLHKSLRKEVEEHSKNNKDSELDFILLILKSLESSSTNIMNEEKEPKSKKKKKKENILEFINFEDRFFHEVADFVFSFNVSDTTGLASWDHKDKPKKSLRTVALINATKWQAVVDKLELEMEGELTYEDGME